MSANTECKKSASLSIQQRRGRRPEGYILLHTVRKARSAWVRLSQCVGGLTEIASCVACMQVLTSSLLTHRFWTIISRHFEASAFASHRGCIRLAPRLLARARR